MFNTFSQLFVIFLLHFRVRKKKQESQALVNFFSLAIFVFICRNFHNFEFLCMLTRFIALYEACKACNTVWLFVSRLLPLLRVAMSTQTCCAFSSLSFSPSLFLLAFVPVSHGSKLQLSLTCGHGTVFLTNFCYEVTTVFCRELKSQNDFFSRRREHFIFLLMLG